MSKTMTRFLSLLLIAVLAISLCGCGGEGNQGAKVHGVSSQNESRLKCRSRLDGLGARRSGC